MTGYQDQGQWPSKGPGAGKHKHPLNMFPATLLKKRPRRRCFLVNFSKLLTAPFLQNTSRGLLLNLYDNNHHFMMYRYMQMSVEEIKFPMIYQVNFFKNSDKQTISCESAKWRAQRAHVPYVPMCLTCPTCPTCPRAQVYFTDWKIKNIGFNEIKWRFVYRCFQGCWTLIWTLIRISFFKSVPKILNFTALEVKTTLINAKGQNNTYKTNAWKKEEMKTICNILYSYAYIYLLKDI